MIKQTSVKIIKKQNKTQIYPQIWLINITNVKVHDVELFKATVYCNVHGISDQRNDWSCNWAPAHPN